MTEADGSWFSRRTTPFKILAILSAALLPLGLAGAWVAKRNLDSTNQAIEAGARDQGSDAAAAIQSLIERDALVLRIAAHRALPTGIANPCAEVERVLAVASGIAARFSLEGVDEERLCAVGQMGPPQPLAHVSPEEVRMWIASDQQGLHVRIGVIGGSATLVISPDELRRAVAQAGRDVVDARLASGSNRIEIIDKPAAKSSVAIQTPIINGQLMVETTVARRSITLLERLVIFLPLLMWAAAAIVCWWMTHRLLTRPLRRLQATIVDYEPGDGDELQLPPGLGPATEIHELGQAFRRAVGRVEGAERDAREALDGQRRLVREVHHRVKNNLQVIASLLSIHGRNANEGEAKDAYSSIGRRVDALSVVHRNHYAELEESRGIALRPLLTELAAGLRASAPAESRAMGFELDVDSVSTTQDTAVAAAFLVTEIVEYSMLHAPKDPIRIVLRRTGELTASLSLESSVLVPDEAEGDSAKHQFERIVEGLARQLRSPLDRRLGIYSVTLPVFPER